MVFHILICHFRVLHQSPSSKLQVFFGDLLMLPDLGVFPSDDGFGAFTPLTVHQVRLFELVLEEPIPVGLGALVAKLASDDEALGLTSIPHSCLCASFQEALHSENVIEDLELGLLETPVVSKLVHISTRHCLKVRLVVVETVKVNA